jgi:hypothetical protein
MAQLSSPAPNKIVLKASFSEGGTEADEGYASGALLPGMNVNMTTAAHKSFVYTYAAGATPAGGTAAGAAAGAVRVVKEDSLTGKTVDDAYTSGSIFRFHNCKPGDIVQVLALSGEDIDQGEGVSANAAGKWIAATISQIAVALEDTGGALAADTLIRVRIL